MFHPTKEHTTIGSFNKEQKRKRMIVTIIYSVVAIVFCVLSFPVWLIINIVMSFIPEQIKEFGILIAMIIAILSIAVYKIIEERRMYSDVKE